MKDIFPALVALAGLGFFLGILVWHVPRTDLTAVIAVTLLLAVADLVLTARDRARSARRRRDR